MSYQRATCAYCRRGYRYAAPEAAGPPASCGRLLCRARADWTPEDWAGKARMARARQAAGVALDDLDREALRRTA